MINVLKKINLKILALGHLVFQSFDYSFDYILYPFVIYKFGPLKGGFLMTILSTAICFSLLLVYDFLEKDWLGIETAKELVENFFKEEEENARRSWKRRGKKLLSWVFHRNKVGQFLFLSLHFDPLITVIYMRPGYHLYNGFTKRDWKIFWGSTIVSNAWWTGIAFVVIAALKDVILRFF